MPEELGIRQFRAQAAAVLRRAAAGERIVITVAGKPVAQLGPLEATREAELTLDDLVARGLLARAHRSDRPAPSMQMTLPTGTRMDKLMVDVRGR